MSGQRSCPLEEEPAKETERQPEREKEGRESSHSGQAKKYEKEQ